MQPNNIHPLFEQYVRSETRRQFFRQGGNALGAAALAALGMRLASYGAGNSERGGANSDPAHLVKCRDLGLRWLRKEWCEFGTRAGMERDQ